PPPGGAMPAGSTRVTVTLETVTLEDDAGGTRLTLRHENLPSESLREGHDVAWDTYLPRLAVRAAGGDPGPDPHA
ncbi:MAG: SRPBCC domain-containing protein, partial [Streptosporangiaceae bacterium]